MRNSKEQKSFEENLKQCHLHLKPLKQSKYIKDE